MTIENEKWFALSVAQTEQKLKTNAASGLSPKAARSRSYNESGEVFVTRKKKSGRMILELLSDFSLIVMLVVAVCALAFGEYILGGVVCTLFLIDISALFFLSRSSFKGAEDANKAFLPSVNVIRSGKLYRIHRNSVVVGDVMIFEEGDIICADARLVTSNSLSVIMPSEDGEERILEKFALARVDENEHDPSKMTTMVHAGSVVASGSGRAIVTAVGKYTYIGAMTGGIDCTYDKRDKMPEEISRMKTQSASLNLSMLLAVLPLTIVSLLFASLGGTATLSVSFLTYLALSATMMSGTTFGVCRVFYSLTLKKLASDPSMLICRSDSVVDDLGKVKYLFLLDGSSLTDGKYTINKMICSEGEISSFETPTVNCKHLGELSVLYNKAEALSPTGGAKLPEKYRRPIQDLNKKLCIDQGALDIRCTIVSYSHGSTSGDADKLIYSEYGKSFVLSVSDDEIFADRSCYYYASGENKFFEPERKRDICGRLRKYREKGNKLLVFTRSTLDSHDSDDERVFVGALVLSEGVDPQAKETISALGSMGIKVIRFVGKDDEPAPAIPVELLGGSPAFANAFEKNGLDITYGFGSFDHYVGFDENDLIKLLRAAKKRNEKIAVIGFSTHSRELIDEADVFISCADIRDREREDRKKALDSYSSRGLSDSASSYQSVRFVSNALIKRPSDGVGGLGTILRAKLVINNVFSACSLFFSYLLTVQAVRLILIGVPLLFGFSDLDARHVLLSGALVDHAVLVLLAFRSKVFSTARKQGRAIPRIIRDYSFKGVIKDRFNKRQIICAAVASFIGIALPCVLELFGVTVFMYRTEYMLLSLLLLQLAAVFRICYGSPFSKRTFSGVIGSAGFVGISSAIFIFVIVCLLIPSFGALFDVTYVPALYVALALIPSLGYLLSSSIAIERKKTK